MPNFIRPSNSLMINYLVLRFGDLRPYPVSGSCITGSNCCYMVVFHYGSIVLFNAREHEVDDYLKIVKRHASITEMLPEMKRYEYEVREKPDSNKLMEAGLDYLMLQFLNIDGIQTIGSVLGRSIALDYYGCQVDGIVAECTDIKREMEKTGTYSIGKATSNVGDVRFKLGLLRLDTAEDKYFELWEYLRDEFELTQRFASLDFKLKFVEILTHMTRRSTAQYPFSSRNPSEQEVRFFGMAHNHSDKCRDYHFCFRPHHKVRLYVKSMNFRSTERLEGE